MIRTKGMYKFGIGFWIGGGVYSIINMIMNYFKEPQNKILGYNYIITSVAILGLLLNIFLLKRKEREEILDVRF